ncbi:hypothetical protein Tco_0054312, partial [Tanacetum coccineum]
RVAPKVGYLRIQEEQILVDSIRDQDDKKVTGLIKVGGIEGDHLTLGYRRQQGRSVGGYLDVGLDDGCSNVMARNYNGRGCSYDDVDCCLGDVGVGVKGGIIRLLFRDGGLPILIMAKTAKKENPAKTEDDVNTWATGVVAETTKERRKRMMNNEDIVEIDDDTDEFHSTNNKIGDDIQVTNTPQCSQMKPKKKKKVEEESDIASKIQSSIEHVADAMKECTKLEFMGVDQDLKVNAFIFLLRSPESTRALLDCPLDMQKSILNEMMGLMKVGGIEGDHLTLGYRRQQGRSVGGYLGVGLDDGCSNVDGRTSVLVSNVF